MLVFWVTLCFMSHRCWIKHNMTSVATSLFSLFRIDYGCVCCTVEAWTGRYVMNKFPPEFQFSACTSPALIIIKRTVGWTITGKTVFRNCQWKRSEQHCSVHEDIILRTVDCETVLIMPSRITQWYKSTSLFLIAHIVLLTTSPL